MRQRLISSVLILTVILAWSGCQSVPEEHKGAAVGAGVGAAAGTALGAVLGKDTKSAVLGGVFGALVGGAIGHYAYDKQKTREETVKTYNYEASKGTILTIEDASSSPETASPGDLVELKMTYAVLNPAPNTKSKITEIREITHNGGLVGNPEVTVDRVDGTYTSTVPLKLSANAEKGVYKVRSTVQSENAKDTREASFTVQ